MNETTWNYRVVVTKHLQEYHYSIREVYYEKEKIKMWSESDSEPFGESLEELKRDYEMMAEAFEKPVLIERGSELVEFKK